MGKIERRIIAFYTFFWLTVIALVGAIAVCCYELQKESQKEKNQLQDYIDSYNSVVQQFNQDNESLSDVDVCFLGDSLTAGYDVAAYYSEFNVVNRGIPGDTINGFVKDDLVIPGLSSRLDVSAYDLNPKVVVMLIGGNDVLRGEDSQIFMVNYESLLKKLKSNLPTTKVVLVSLTAMGGDCAVKNSTAQQNNQKIQKLANDFTGFQFVNVFTPLCNGGTEIDPSYAKKDGVHLTEAGYQVLTSQIKPVVQSFLAS